MIDTLLAGSYTATVTDANNCSVSINFTITQPSALTASNGNPVHVTCYGNASGAITITATNGTAPYNVSWSGPSSGNPAGTEINVSGGTFNITSLLAGNYTATITDANGCTANRIFTINQPTQISITNALTHINCFAANTGASSVTVTGGS
ncbi:MAG: hypothetical protein EBS91_10005, partial [Betaproteobacteria bacterium]|nr:hypothetical protein [Betaproteobacteria bacterium]